MSEAQHTQSSSMSDGEIDLRELFRVLWAGRWLIGGITAAAAVVSVIVVLMLPNTYRAEALLAPNSQDGAGGLSALAAQYGGLASLAGINFGSSSADEVAVGLEVLKSRKFISEFIERHDILVPLIAASEWDSETGELEIDPGLYDESSNAWVRDVSPPKKTVPSLQEAFEEFSDILSVGQDNNSGLVTVSIEHYSPIIAKQWVDWLIEDLNRSTMRRDVTAAEQAIEYLNEQIEKTSIAELQKVFVSLIEEQTKTVMLAEVSDEYLLTTLDPAVVPELKAGPNRKVIVILLTLLGGSIGVVVHLLWYIFVPSNAHESSNRWRAKEA